MSDESPQNLYTGLLLIGVVILSGCTGKTEEISMAGKQVSLKTEDGFSIVSTFHEANSDTGIILLHMLNRNRNDWNHFAEQLQKENYKILSIDLRGHGQSTSKNGRNVGWQTFSESDFNDMILDVKAAKEFLEQKNVKKFVVIGASIGANIAINYAAEDSEISGVILLSPSLDYRGVKPESSVKDYGNRSILIVASEDDEYSASSSKALHAMAVGKKEFKLYEDAGHGNRMFPNTDLDKVIINWLKSNV